jgi:hypothetical protein
MVSFDRGQRVARRTVNENMSGQLLFGAAVIGTDQNRRPELVSASMPLYLCEIAAIQIDFTVEAWVLKRVQDDGGGTKGESDKT